MSADPPDKLNYGCRGERDGPEIEGEVMIGKAARRVGLTARAIRYYERIGLVVAASRSGQNYRLYDQGALNELRFISRCRAIGLSVAEIRALCAGPTEEPTRSGMAAAMYEQLRLTEKRIHELLSIWHELRRQVGLQGISTDPNQCAVAASRDEPRPRRRMA